MTTTVTVRTGSPDPKLSRDEFRARYRKQFVDPAFDPLQLQIAQLEDAAWDAYDHHRKAPRTTLAGPGHADPDYGLSNDWIATRAAIRDAQVRHDAAGSPRILVVSASARNEHTCPGEYSKTSRLAAAVVEALHAAGCLTDELDLSRMTAEYGKTIYPCKGCVSTAMPLCHWPCSCYPNHSLGQTRDWMADIYPLWVEAHGIVIVTPVYWYQAPAVLKLMIDRLVCSDGGNPDPSSTQGKDAKLAKALELASWPYPRHLAGRVFGVVVHGDAGGAETLRRNLVDWLSESELELAGGSGELDRYIGYMEPYATSHDALDDDAAVVEEARNVARCVAERVAERRSGVPRPGATLKNPRPK